MGQTLHHYRTNLGEQVKQEFVNRIMVLAHEIFGENSQEWLYTENRLLGDKTPMTLMNSEKGRKRIWYLLNAHAGQ